MSKLPFSNKKYLCACQHEISVFVSKENTGQQSCLKGEDGKNLYFSGECSNSKCPFTIAILNLEGHPIPFLVSFHPMPEIEGKIITQDKDIVN